MAHKSSVSIIRLFLVLSVLWECTEGVKAQDEGCYTPGSMAGIVIATIVVTLIMGGLAAAFVWYLWKQRKGVYGDGKSQEKPIACPPMSPDKEIIVNEKNDYAFDNPYFKDDETDTASPDAAEKGESGFHVDNGSITPTQNAKASNGTACQQKKNRPFSSLPFHAVFHPSGKKQRATMDDTYISKHLERITVPLRGHDFTGLGFNICGNMRDGIFVKDVLHRGPASESGKIKAGDRIVGVTVSFAAMVYEDALTILSYASPYDVKLEIEKSPTASTVGGVSHFPSSSPKRLGASISFRSNGQRRLFHPLYRSQSIDDLTQIGKDSFLNGNTTGIQRDSSSSATPKRSQSVEASNGGPKSRPAYVLKSSDNASSKSLSSNKSNRKSSTSSCESADKAATESHQQASTEEAPCIKKEVKSSRFRVEQISVKSEAPSIQQKAVPPTKPARDIPDDKQPPETGAVQDQIEKNEKVSIEISSENSKLVSQPVEAVRAAEAEILETEKPTAPPRKAGTPSKRRAPAPPPPVAIAKTETSAIVHRVDDLPDVLATQPEASVLIKEPASEPPPPPTSELPEFSTSDRVQEQDLGSSDNSSLASGGHTSQKDAKEETSSPSKRKASSLGDLTKLDHGTSKKASTSSAILERAVSLDLQQSLPGENLIKQKKILHVPTFEDDCDENREGDFPDGEGLGLKRWDDGLDKVFVELTNGDARSENVLHEDEVSDPASSSVVTVTNIVTTTEQPTTDHVDENPATEEKNIEEVDLDFDSSIEESTQDTSQESEIQVTSTPAKKIIEVKPFLEDDEDMLDDIPYLDSAKQHSPKESSVNHSSHINNSSSIPVFSPVTISIPVIKPDLTHFEKLPSPPPASTHPALDPSWRFSKTTITTTSDDGGKLSPLERISVQSLYRPIFSNKEVLISEDSPAAAEEKLVNGNDSDSSEHYSTAQENTTSSSVETSTLSVTLSSTTVANNVATAKAPNNVAGFAKTLIIPGPNEVENLLSLAAEPNTPPPSLDPPPKPVENE